MSENGSNACVLGGMQLRSMCSAQFDHLVDRAHIRVPFPSWPNSMQVAQGSSV